MSFSTANKAMYLYFTNNSCEALAFIFEFAKRIVVCGNITTITFEDDSGVRCYFDTDDTLVHVEITH